MAEFVQAGLEEMLQELQQLQRVQLLSPDEVRMVVKKRKEYEYKMQKQQKQKEDILAYIQYESSLLHLIGIRRDQSKYTNKKDEIDYAIARRINKLFRILEHRFPADLKIWSSHVAFLDQIGWKEYIGKVYRRMLQVHPEKVPLWISAARAEIRQGQGENVENARTLLMESLRFHPQDQSLYLECFSLELLFIDSLKHRPSGHLVADESKALILAGRVAETIFRKGVEQSCATDEEKIELTERCLGLCQDLKAPLPLYKGLIEHLEQHHATDPKSWEIKAIMSLSNFTSFPSNRPRTRLDKIRECCQAYEQGLAKGLPSDIPIKRKRLLDSYIATLQRIAGDNTITNNKDEEKTANFVAERIWSALDFGARHQILSAESEELFRHLKVTES